MKNYITSKALILLFVVLSTSIYAQKKEIKVQIIHNNKIVLDTTLYKTSDEAKVIITNLVQRFSTYKVTIDTKLTHGLYVFNITNESWKEPDKETYENSVMVSENKSREDYDNTEETPQINSTSSIDDIDSLFREFSDELDKQWKMANIEVFIDSIGSAFNSMKNEISKIDFENDPEIQDLKHDFQDFIEKIRATKIVIIQEGDTININ